MDSVLINKLGRPLPRYTSYPTTPHFRAEIGREDYESWIGVIPRGSRLSLYVHIPVCDSLCWYCGCNTKMVSRHAPVAKYVDTLLLDIDATADRLRGDFRVSHVHLGGAWVQPRLGEREHRYWPRSERDGAVVQDGRLDGFIAEMKEPYDVPVDPLCYDHPVMVTPIGDSGWSVVHVVQRKACPSLSANRTWHAHDFSLIGHDVSEGDQLSCRAWMAYAKLESLDDALSLHKRLDAEEA